MLDFDPDDFLDWLPYLIGALNMLVTSATLAWVLMTKPDSTSAVAWCLLIIFLPFVGAVFFYFFGYQHINRPLARKRQHKASSPPLPPRRARKDSGAPDEPEPDDAGWKESLAARMAILADRFGAYP